MKQLSEANWPYFKLKFDKKYLSIYEEGYEDAKSGKLIVAAGEEKTLESLIPYPKQDFQSFFYYLGYTHFSEYNVGEATA